MSGHLRVAAFGVVLATASFNFADAAQVKIISGPATAGVLAQIAPQFEQETGNTLSSKGGVTGVLKKLIEEGEPFDLAIIPGPLMADFVSQGKIVASTSAPFVRVGMGLAVRTGATKPDAVRPLNSNRQSLTLNR